jgi:hypothetical protein
MIKNLIVVMMSACCLAVPVYGMMDMWTPQPTQDSLLQQRNMKYEDLVKQYEQTTVPELSTLPTLQQEDKLQQRYNIATELVRLCAHESFGEKDFVTGQEFWDKKRAESLAKLLNLQWKLDRIEHRRLREKTITMPNPPAAQDHGASLHHKRRCIIL